MKIYVKEMAAPLSDADIERICRCIWDALCWSRRNPTQRITWAMEQTYLTLGNEEGRLVRIVSWMPPLGDYSPAACDQVAGDVQHTGGRGLRMASFEDGFRFGLFVKGLGILIVKLIASLLSACRCGLHRLMFGKEQDNERNK